MYTKAEVAGSPRAPELANGVSSPIKDGAARRKRISSHSTASHSSVCFVFGYGSVINNESRLSTTQGQGQGQSQEVVQYAYLKASAGYVREWSFRSATGFTALGIRHVGEGNGSR
eukprot:1178295-Prorocentrum_minimum.AAC.1